MCNLVGLSCGSKQNLTKPIANAVIYTKWHCLGCAILVLFHFFVQFCHCHLVIALPYHGASMQVAVLRKFLDRRGQRASTGSDGDNLDGTGNDGASVGDQKASDWGNALRVHIYQPSASESNGSEARAGGSRRRVDWCLHLKVARNQCSISGEYHLFVYPSCCFVWPALILLKHC